MTPKKTIFICYRRDDAEGYAGRIYDRLHARFPGRVFMDVTGINPGADFTRVIQDTVGSCGVLLAIIGKQWLTIKDEGDTPRIQKSDDYVRHEIATALYRNVPVIPVLVRDARMPGENTLPPDLASLSTRNALEISDTDFEHDALRLIAAIEYLFRETRPAPLPVQPQKSKRTCLILAIVGIVVGGGALLLIIVFGTLISTNQNRRTDDTYVTPEPTYSQQPQPSEAPFNSESFNPVGNWVLQVEGEAPVYITINPDHSYEVGGAIGQWSYEDGELTLTSTTTTIPVTIEKSYGNGYRGHATIYGVQKSAALLRQ
jgi:hypothetical protein